MTLMLQCDIICIHFHTLYLCAKPMKVPKRESQFCQTYIWNTAVKCPLSEAVGGTFITSSVVLYLHYATEECDIPTCILLMDMNEEREGIPFP